MTVMVRTKNEPVASRHDDWQDLIDDTAVPFEGEFVGGSDFSCSMVAGSVGAIDVAEATMPPGVCLRSPARIRLSDPDVYKVDVMAVGRAVVQQDGRESVVGPGDLLLLDPSRPVRIIHSAIRNVSLTVPRTMLPLRSDDVTQLTGIRIPGDRGVAALVSSLALQLPRHLDDCGTAESVRLGTAVIDLLTVALSTQLRRTATIEPGTRQQALLHRIHAFIEQRLGDPELSPSAIAEAHYISLRYLHKLFEAQDVTVAGWVRRRRLERCRTDLVDPTLRARPLSAIAGRWGFGSAVHFSRAFRAAYGLPPSEYRKQRDPRLAPAPDAKARTVADDAFTALPSEPFGISGSAVHAPASGGQDGR
jgi:AraC-like DNA-binding protein